MRSAMLVSLFMILGCGAKPRPIHEVMVCDRSTSASCDESLVRKAMLRFLDDHPPPGSRAEVLVTGCGVDDVVRAFRIDVPIKWGSGVAAKKKAWRAAKAERLADLTLPVEKRCSGIAEAIWRAGRILEERQGSDRRLIVISDLRETSRRLKINFERRVLGAEEFVTRLRDASLLPDLRGVQAEVCGVHDRGTPDSPHWSALMSAQLRAAWGYAFCVMGQKDLPLREACSFDRAPAPTRGEE